MVLAVGVIGGGACGQTATESGSSPVVLKDGNTEDVGNSPTDLDPLGESERPARVVFDFIANRVLAHRFVREAWFASARSGHFDKYIPFGTGGWVLETRGQRAVATLKKKRGSLRVPERLPVNRASRIGLMAFAEQETKLAIGSGRKKLAEVSLQAGWTDVELELGGPIGSRVWFETSGKRAVSLAGVSIGDGDLGGATDDVGRAVLTLSPVDSLSFYVGEAKGATVRGSATSGCQVWVAVKVGELRRKPVQLPAVLESNDASRLDFSLRACEQGTIETLEMTRSRDPSVAEPLPDSPAPKNVVFWVMDTLRADRVRVINSKAQARVPNFERLAKRGVVFRRAWVEGNESKASHASFWTSVFPAVHEVRTAGRIGEWQLKRRLPVMGELVASAGLRPIGLTANGMVTRKAGYSRGFETFENPMRDGTGKRRNGWIPAERMYKRAETLLDAAERERFFFFFGTIDTHKPWVGHQPWLDEYDPGYKGIFQKAAYPGQLGLKKGSMKCTKVPKGRDLQRINAIYDSAISYQDMYLGKLMDRLEQQGLLDETLIVITADHGEELWEVGRCGHGASLRETLVNVPLLISYPRGLPSGVVVEEGVDGVDILPTILELLKVERPAEFQGQSLVGLAQEHGAGYPRASYASQYEYAHAMRIGDWKMRVGGEIEVYDLASDAEEKNNLAGNPGAAVAEQQLADALQLFLRYRYGWKKSTWGVANNVTQVGAKALEVGQ